MNIPVRWLQLHPVRYDDLAMPLVVGLNLDASLFADLTQLASRRHMPVGLVIAGLLHSNSVRELVRANLASMR